MVSEQVPFEEESEATEGEDDLRDLPPDAFGGVVVATSDWTVEVMVGLLERGSIDLEPRFQRRSAWRDDRQSRFVESLVLGLPVPQLTLAEMSGRPHRYIVIDGKQRLLTLRRFAAPGDTFEPLRLTQLEFRTAISGKTFDELNSDPAFRDDVEAFHNQPIRTVVLKNWGDVRTLQLIFLRINTEAVPLSPQELRQALHPGPFTDYVDRQSADSEALRKLLRNPGPDFRMRDAELLLRYFAFSGFLADYRGNLKSFLDWTTDTLNREWGHAEAQIRESAAACEEAIDATVMIFGSDAFRRWHEGQYQSRFNRAVFDIMVYYLRDDARRELALSRPERVKSAFEVLSLQSEPFQLSLTATTKSVPATVTRLAEWGSALADALGVAVPIPAHREDGSIGGA